MNSDSNVNTKNDSTQTNSEIGMSLAAVEEKLTLHEPIVLAFAVKNNSAQPVSLDLGQDRKEAFSITVVEPNGNRINLPQLRREGLSRIGKITIAPQQTYTQNLLLNEWHEFSAPGAYDVNVRLGNPGATQNGLKPQETNLHVRLEIGARDPEKLKQSAASLADRASNNSNYEEAAFAALTLGYMNDPVAVPYLAKILTANTMVTPLVITGLERIGGREAAQVLLTALNVQRGETGQLIRTALSNIERNTSDPELKGKIRNAL
jgi:hypothetical protein